MNTKHIIFLLLLCLLLPTGCQQVESTPKTLAVLVDLSESSISNPRLPRWKLERGLDRACIAANQRGENLLVVVIGGRDRLDKFYSKRAIPRAKQILKQLEALRTDQLYAQAKLAHMPAKTPPASGVPPEINFGEYTDHTVALALARSASAGTVISGVVIFTDGFDEDPDGETGRASFTDLAAGLREFCSAQPVRLVVLGPGPEIPEPADGRQMSEAWRDMLTAACSGPDGAPLPGCGFVLKSDYLDFDAAQLAAPSEAANGH